MIIPLVESLVYACASAAARAPMRSRRSAPGRAIRAVSKESADRLSAALAAERQRTAALEAQVVELHVQVAAQAREIQAAHRYFDRLSA